MVVKGGVSFRDLLLKGVITVSWKISFSRRKSIAIPALLVFSKDIPIVTFQTCEWIGSSEPSDS